MDTWALGLGGKKKWEGCIVWKFALTNSKEECSPQTKVLYNWILLSLPFHLNSHNSSYFMKSLWFFPLNRLWLASYSSLKIFQFLSSRRPLLTYVCSALQMPGAQILILISPCNGACPFPIKLWTPSRDGENSCVFST